MRGSTVLLLALLLASNAVWAWFVLGKEAREDAPGAAAPRDGSGAPESTPPRTAPSLAGAPDAAPSRPVRQEGPAPARSASRPPPEAFARAKERGAAWRKDVSQIEDRVRRDGAMEEVGRALSDRDPVLVREALRVLDELDPRAYDLAPVRPAVAGLLGSDSADVRTAAAYLLTRLGAQPGDLDRYLAAMAHDTPPSSSGAHAAIGLNGGRVDGAVADLFLRLLASEDLRRATEAANALRGRWTPLAVQEAVVAVWERDRAAGTGRGPWFHILGQIVPHRAPVLRAVFEALREADDPRAAVQLMADPLHREVEPEDQPVLADLAGRTLAATTDTWVRRSMVDLLARYGTAAQRDLLARLAQNDLLPETDRAAAVRALDAVDRRR